MSTKEWLDSLNKEQALNVVLAEFDNKYVYAVCNQTNKALYKEKEMNITVHKAVSYTQNVGLLFPLVEKLGLNAYVSYSPSKKKYRARVWEYFKISHKEKQSDYIYEKTPSLALAKALVRAIEENK